MGRRRRLLPLAHRRERPDLPASRRTGVGKGGPERGHADRPGCLARVDEQLAGRRSRGTPRRGSRGAGVRRRGLSRYRLSDRPRDDRPLVAPIMVASGNGAPALPAGIRILARGGSALDAVEACAKIIEADSTDTSVGRGGRPNVLGEVELDASIVDGTTHRTGAVAALTGYLHPISVARAVMERTPHVFIVGEGAARFAREIGAETAQNLTPSTRKLWVERLRSVGETPASLPRRLH